MSVALFVILPLAGAFLGWTIRWLLARLQLSTSEQKALRIVSEALRDAEAKKTVAELGASMGLRAIDVGPLTNAGPVEGLTAVLATVNRRYKLKNSGIQITGLGESHGR